MVPQMGHPAARSQYRSNGLGLQEDQKSRRESVLSGVTSSTSPCFAPNLGRIAIASRQPNCPPSLRTFQSENSNEPTDEASSTFSMTTSLVCPSSSSDSVPTPLPTEYAEEGISTVRKTSAAINAPFLTNSCKQDFSAKHFSELPEKMPIGSQEESSYF